MLQLHSDILSVILVEHNVQGYKL